MFKKYICALLLTIIICCSRSYAEPWFTGPLIANSGEVVPLGQGSFTLFNYYANSTAIYNRQWTKRTIPRFTTTTINPQLIYGLARNVDIEYDMMFIKNDNNGHSRQNIGDTSVMLGFQVVKQQGEHSFPSLRVTIDQIFPTGRYDTLNPLLYGTDVTGSGSYQTAFGLNFQHRLHLSEHHDLNSFFNIIYTYEGSVHLHGLNAYGGDPDTRGDISPGNALTLNLAFEYNLSQNLVTLLEGFFLYQQSSVFNGTPGSLPLRLHHRHDLNRIIPSKRNIGKAIIGNGNVAEISLFPELEYNFSEHWGIIGGVWFTATGKNMPEFVSSSLSLVVNW